MGYFPVENIDDYITLNDELRESVAQWHSAHPELSVTSWYSIAVRSEDLNTLYQSVASQVGQLYHRALDENGPRIAFNFEIPLGEITTTLSLTRAMFLFDESYLQPWIAGEVGDEAEKYCLEDAVLLLFAWEVPELLINIDDKLQPSGSIRGENPLVLSTGAVLLLPLEDEEDAVGDTLLVQFPSEAALAHSASFVGAMSQETETMFHPEAD